MYCIGPKDVEAERRSAPPLEEEPSLGRIRSPHGCRSRLTTCCSSRARVISSRCGCTTPTASLCGPRAQDECQFRVAGPGEVAADGTYTAPKNEGHVGALVYCKVGELEGKGRVRIVPPLPWAVRLQRRRRLPITWIGGRVRYVFKEIDGERAAYKLDVLPVPGRSGQQARHAQRHVHGPRRHARLHGPGRRAADRKGRPAARRRGPCEQRLHAGHPAGRPPARDLQLGFARLPHSRHGSTSTPSPTSGIA